MMRFPALFRREGGGGLVARSKTGLDEPIYEVRRRSSLRATVTHDQLNQMPLQSQ